jgi:hypothetical protein
MLKRFRSDPGSSSVKIDNLSSSVVDSERNLFFAWRVQLKNIVSHREDMIVRVALPFETVEMVNESAQYGQLTVRGRRRHKFCA